MRLTGLHAQGALTLEDALAKLGAGKLTPAEFGQLQGLMRAYQSSITPTYVVPQVAALLPFPAEPK